MPSDYQTVKDSLILVSLITFWFILTPIFLYYLWIFYVHRYSMQLRKRHYETVVCCGLFCILFWTVERPIGLIWSSRVHVFGSADIKLTILHYILFPFTVYGLLWSFIWRYWLVYYDTCLALSTYSNEKWKSIINSSNKENDFFLKLQNRQTFGNVKWTFYRFLIIFFIFFISSSILQILPSFHYYNSTTGVLLDGCLNLLSFIVLLIIYSQTPRFTNAFYIRDELKYILFGWCALYIVYFVGTGLNQLININYFTLTIIQTYAGIICTTEWFYLSTRWILQKFNLHSRRMTADIYNVKSINLHSNSSISNTDLNRQCSSNALHLKLYQLLSTDIGFNCFINHLIYEFSEECLLSFIEFIQWKKLLIFNLNKLDTINELNELNELDVIQDDKYTIPILPITKQISLQKIVKKISLPISIDLSMRPKLFNKYSNSTSLDSVNSNNKRNNILLINFPQNVPKSSIVYDHIPNPVVNHDENINDENEQNVLNAMSDYEQLIYSFKIKAEKLHKKYIITASEFQININSKQRKKLNVAMNDLNKWRKYDIDGDELSELYDHCIEEMYKLMQDSFGRFKSTKQFMELDQAKIFQSL